jgi:hypothetical protein
MKTVRQALGSQFVPFEIIDRGWHLAHEQMDELSEEILSNEFDAFICMILPQAHHQPAAGKWYSRHLCRR